MSYDNVNHPKHYVMAQKSFILEPIDICEKYSFCQGNAIKYLLRYENKNGVEDLKKALWYLNRISNENLEIWRCAAKYSDVIYANITIITKKMNFIEHQRMIYNIKRFFAFDAEWLQMVCSNGYLWLP